MCDSEETFYEDERRLKNSGVRNVFTPHTPINQENLFRGRINEVQQILSTLNTPGQHVLLFGERGVGKSSLANIASNKLIKIAGKELVVKRCSKSDSFSTIFEDVLLKCGVDISISTKNNTSSVTFNGFGYTEPCFRDRWLSAGPSNFMTKARPVRNWQTCWNGSVRIF